MRLPFDQHVRRRLYLVRHGESAARQDSDGLYGDQIVLTARGEEEAKAMAETLGQVRFDEVYSSDIYRARQTAEIVVGARNLTIEPSARFTEMRGDIATVLRSDRPALERQISFAYAMWSANEEGSAFFGGDTYAAYLARTAQTLTDFVRESTASNILIVSHSGFQRAALCWVLDALPVGLAKFEQDTCCLNILDIDIDAAGNIVRKHVRLANYTPLDPVKDQSRLTDGERLAHRFVPVSSATQ